MGDKKKTKFLEYASLWGWPTDKDEAKEQWKDFRANMEEYFDQLKDIQKTVIEARKDAWNKIFPKLMDMQDKFAATLPEELPTVPGGPTIDTKDVVDKIREFQQTANDHAVERADSFIEFAKQRQEQVKDTVKEAVDKAEEKLD